MARACAAWLALARTASGVGGEDEAERIVVSGARTRAA